MKGYYEKVADIDCKDLSAVQSIACAWVATQNGILSPSWSRKPLDVVMPEGNGLVIYKGKKLGRRSTKIGDVFTIGYDQKFYVAKDCFMKF